MKNTLYFLLFSSFLVLFSACNNKEEIKNTDVKVEEVTDQPDVIKNEDDERSNWQKPNLIIEKLGNLQGKVVADIGAGALGYFVFKLIAQTSTEKVIAVDIDQEAIGVLNQLKSFLSDEKKNRLDVRLAQANNPKLKNNEVDKILIVNTASYIENRVAYFKNLHNSMKENGQLLIVDFKTKRIPEDIGAPPYSSREYLHVFEEELYKAGFKTVVTDDTSLEFQYLLSAFKN